MLLHLIVVGPHPHDLYLATFGRSAVSAATVCLSAALPDRKRDLGGLSIYGDS